MGINLLCPVSSSHNPPVVPLANIALPAQCTEMFQQFIAELFVPVGHTNKRLRQLSLVHISSAKLLFEVVQPSVESRYVVPGVLLQSLIKSYLVTAIGSGSDTPARTISRSSWRRYGWRLSDTARTDDHLPRAARHHRTGRGLPIRSRDRSCARVLGL